MDFDLLKELVSAITRNKVKSIEVLDNDGNNDNSKTWLLYQGISDGKIKSDKDAVLNLFQSDNERHSAYIKLKAKLKRQLMNTAFFVDTNKPLFNERTRAYYQCNSDFASANILLLRNAPKSAADILTDINQIAIRYEFTDLCVDSARVLRQLYGRTIQSLPLHKKYTEVYKTYLPKRDAEFQAEDCFETLIQYYMVRQAPDEDIKKLCIEFLKELAPLEAVADTALFLYRISIITIIRYEADNDYRNALDTCNKYLKIMEGRQNASSVQKFAIAGQKLSCLTQLRRFDDGEFERTIQYCLSFAEEGNFNWFRIHEQYIQHCIAGQNYKLALDIYEKAFLHPNFSRLQGQIREHWHLIGGYFHLLAAFGRLDGKVVDQLVGPFRYQRFVNDISILARDKSGMNVPLILLPVLFALANGTADEADISTEALELYRWRYLRGPLHQRSSHFIRLLNLLLKSPLDPKEPRKKMKALLTAIRSEAPKPSRDATPSEIIPYEDLWEMLTGEVDKKP